MAFNGTLQNSNITAGYMDLATAWKLEGEYLYGLTPVSAQFGNPCAKTFFTRVHKRSTWFTQIPVVHRISNSSPEFGREFSVVVARIGEYLLNSWVRVTLPEVTLLPGNQFGADGRLRWCRKVMHNLIEDCTITVNDQQIARLDNHILDFYSSFSVDANKKFNYDRMIGDVEDLVGSHGPTTSLGATIPATTLNLPLPFFYAQDSGLALPTAAILFGDIKINFKFRNWNELLILDNSGPAGAGTVARAVPQVGVDIAAPPALRNVSVWGTYALVSDHERRIMASTRRDMIIEQFQTATKMAFNPITQPTPVYEPKFVMAVKALYFGARNTTFENERSNYSTASPYNDGAVINYKPSGAAAPIKDMTLNYESTTRLSAMSWDYFSQIVPYFCAPSVPYDIGYGLYSYALFLDGVDASGSTNYGKIGVVQVSPTASEETVLAAQGSGDPESGCDFPQTFTWHMIARSSTVIRVADGQLSFPYI
jgi:hypothetical protein